MAYYPAQPQMMVSPCGAIPHVVNDVVILSGREPEPETAPVIQQPQPPMQYQPPPMQYQQPPRQYQQPPMQYQQPPMQYQQPPLKYISFNAQPMGAAEGKKKKPKKPKKPKKVEVAMLEDGTLVQNVTESHPWYDCMGLCTDPVED